MSMDVIQPVEANFTPSYAERIHAELFLLWRSPVALVFTAAFPAAGLWLAILLLRHPATTSASAWLAVLLAFGFSPAIFLWNSYRAHRATQAQGPVSYVFDSEGVHISARLARSFYRWPAILRVRTSPAMLFVYFSRRCAHFVPLRALQEPRAIEIVRQLARAGGVPSVGI